jgi:hypothetical protein
LHSAVVQVTEFMDDNLDDNRTTSYTTRSIIGRVANSGCHKERRHVRPPVSTQAQA